MASTANYPNKATNPHCPRCASALRRIDRSIWMRLLPFSKHLRCNSCYTNYVRFCGILLGPL